MDAFHQADIPQDSGQTAIPGSDDPPGRGKDVGEVSALPKTVPERRPSEHPLFRALRMAEECGNVGALRILLERRRAKVTTSADPDLLAGLQVWIERTEAVIERERAAGGPGSLLDPGHRINQMVDRALARRGLQREHGYGSLIQDHLQDHLQDHRSVTR